MTINHALGDRGFFLGFPFGFKTDDKSNINARFPFALIKSAIFSGVIHAKGIRLLLLDGMNNPGFSGGPVIFKDRTINDKSWHVVAVVSAYVNQYNQLITPIGKINYSENSGIIVAIPSEYVLEIINSK